MKTNRIHSILQNPKNCWLCNKKILKTNKKYIVYNMLGGCFISKQNSICNYCSSFYFYKCENRISVYFKKNNISYCITILQKDKDIVYYIYSVHSYNCHILSDSLNINCFKKQDFKLKALNAVKKYEENLIFT